MKQCVNAGREHVLVIVPTLKVNLDYLKACLKSISNCGVLVCVKVVDSSQAETPMLFENEAITSLQTEPKGLSVAVNAAANLSVCDAEYITWIGDDDFYEQNGLAHLLVLLRSRNDAVFAVGSCRYVSSDGREIQILRPSFLQKFMTKFVNTKVPQPATLVRRSAWNRVNGLNESLKFTMDLDLWFKLWEIGPSCTTREICANYRWHRSSLSSSSESASASEALNLRIARFGRVKSFACVVLTRIFLLRVKFFRSKLNSLKA